MVPSCHRDRLCLLFAVNIGVSIGLEWFDQFYTIGLVSDAKLLQHAQDEERALGRHHL